MGDIPSRVHVVINPASGQEQPILHTLNSILVPAGIDWDVSVTKQANDGCRLAQAAVEAGAEVVAACGGDGTVMQVASGLIGTSVPLAILPAGTANVMSIELGIPGDLAAACRLISSETRTLRPVDMGQASQRYFMLRASTGLEAERVKGASRDLKERFGSLAYAISALQQDFQSTYTYHLTLDDQRVDTEGITCIIANSGNMGKFGLSLLPNIDVSDGLLDVIVLRSGNLQSLVSMAANVVRNRESVEEIQHWQVREVLVETDQPQTVQADGEIWGDTPLQARVLPSAVQVIVPAPEEGA